MNEGDVVVRKRLHYCVCDKHLRDALVASIGRTIEPHILAPTRSDMQCHCRKHATWAFYEVIAGVPVVPSGALVAVPGGKP